MGLKKIHSFSQQGVYILRIDLEDWKEEKHWAEYHFSLEGPSKDYTIQVSHFSGDLPDAMANSTGMRFLTKDRNNENHRNSNCTRNYTGKQFYKPIQNKGLIVCPHKTIDKIMTKTANNFCTQTMVVW